MSVAERPIIEHEVNARLQQTLRWLPDNRGFFTPPEIKETNEDHTNLCRQFSRSLFQLFPDLSIGINPKRADRQLLVHDLGEFYMGDILSTTKASLPEDELKRVKEQELADFERIAEEIGLDDEDRDLYKSFMFWCENPEFPMESIFSQYVDKYVNMRTFTTHVFKRPEKKPKTDTVNEIIFQDIVIPKIGERLGRLMESHERTATVFELIEHSFHWLVMDLNGLHAPEAVELIAAGFDKYIPEFYERYGKNYLKELRQNNSYLDSFYYPDPLANI